MPPFVPIFFRRLICMVFSITLVSLFACPGCSGGKYKARVSGTVTLDGNPIGPGLVTFAPVERGATPAVGQVQLDGSYFMTTNHQTGLSPGTYLVAIQAFEPPEGLAPGERRMEPSKSLVPVRYMSVETSQLQFVVESGRNSIDIPLTSN